MEISLASIGVTKPTLREIPHEELQAKIQQLQERILASHPTMPVLLREIHTILRNQPDNVTLLAEDEIQVIVAGLMKQTMTTIVTKAITTKTKSLKNITTDDL